MPPSQRTPPEDKTSYSYKEIMARLQKSRGSGGRTGRVKRIRIPEEDREPRRRRRRRRRPLALRIIIWTSVALCLSAIIVIPVAISMTMNYYHGSGFRMAVEQRLGALFGMDAVLAPIRLKQLTAVTDGIKFTDRAGSVLKSAEFNKVKTQFKMGTLVSRDWLLLPVSAESATLRFRSFGDYSAGPAAASATKPAGGKEEHSWLGVGGSPAGIVCDSFNVRECTMLLESPDLLGKQRALMEDVRLSVTPGASATEWKVYARDGDLHIAGLSPMHVESLKLRFQEGLLEVVEGDLFLSEGQEIALAGKIGLHPPRHTNFTVNTRGLDLGMFLPQFWQDRLRGSIALHGTLSGDLFQAGGMKAEGEFVVEDGVLRGLKLMRRLAVDGHDARLEWMEFSKTRGRFELGEDGFKIVGLVMERPGVMKITGSIRIAAGQLTGDLRLGLAEDIVEKLGPAKREIFNEGSQGYIFTSVAVSGSATSFANDLTARLDSAVPVIPEAPVQEDSEHGSVADRETEIRNRSLEELFESLIR